MKSTGTTVRAGSVYDLEVEFSEPVVCALICTGRAVGTPCIVCFALVLLDPVMCNLMAAFRYLCQTCVARYAPSPYLWCVLGSVAIIW